jgi:hypothetical protein
MESGMTAHWSRRRFLRTLASAASAVHPVSARAAAQVRVPGAERPAAREPRRDRGLPGPTLPLRERFADLRRHFVFEYYPWYGTNPWFHWNDAWRVPPVDIAATSYPLLGPYDSRDRRVLEQHARWIAEAGVGAVNLSWWGRGSFEDRAVHGVMDVMRDHDIHVAFHLEPYEDRAARLLDDVRYLVREYGDRRGWDAFLLLEDARRRTGPVFKLFGTILPRSSTDCHGVTSPVAGYVEDAEWRRQTGAVRREFARDFDHVTLLADSLDMVRTREAGFDGIANYDDFVAPEAWPPLAAAASDRGLLFSFQVNAGFDSVRPREVAPDSCYAPTPFEPGRRELDWTEEATRAEAMRLSASRIEASFAETIRLQTDPRLANAARGYFLTYINTFNEWHEGTQFEPMKSARDLTPAERAIGYHNPPAGDYRIRLLRQLLEQVL